MLPTKTQGSKKRYIKRDYSKDDEPSNGKEFSSSFPSTQLFNQLLKPECPSLQPPSSKLHHFQAGPSDLTRQSLQEHQPHRRQLITPQQPRREMMRSPSLNSPRNGKRNTANNLSPLHSNEFGHDFRPSPIHADVDSTRAPRSPRPLKRTSTERSSSSHPIYSNQLYSDHSHQTSMYRGEIDQSRTMRPYYDQTPLPPQTTSVQSQNDIHRRYSNEPYQATPRKHINRASAESDTSFNRHHASILSSPPFDNWKSSGGNVVFNQNMEGVGGDDYQQPGQQLTDKSTHWQESNRFEHPQISRYLSRSPIHHKTHITNPQVSGPHYNSPSNDGTKTRSSSLTESISGVQTCPSNFNNSIQLFKSSYQPQNVQNQDLESLNNEGCHKPLYRSGLSLGDERNWEISDTNSKYPEFPSEVVLRPKKDKFTDSDGRNRGSFYDNDSHSDQHQHIDETLGTSESFANSGNTWKSQTAPSSFSIFKRPVYGRISQVIPPHLVGVFDPKKCLPLKRSNSKPTDSVVDDRTYQQRGVQKNRASDSSFRYSDPVSHYERNYSNRPVENEDISTDPKQLNQFLSLYSGPWSRENSLFGRANAAKECKKLETNWKKYEEYQSSDLPKVLAKGKTQKELDEQVELMEKIKNMKLGPIETAPQAEIMQRSSLSRSHESIDSSKDTPSKPRVNFLPTASTKSKSQELPLNVKNSKIIATNTGSSNHCNPVGHPWTPPHISGKKGPEPKKPQICVSMKQLTLSVPEQETRASPSFEQSYDDQSKSPKDPEATKLHTSRLSFQPSSSMSPRLLRKEVQTSEWNEDDIRSCDLGMESSTSSKTDKYITCVTIPESEIFKPEQKITKNIENSNAFVNTVYNTQIQNCSDRLSEETESRISSNSTNNNDNSTLLMLENLESSSYQTHQHPNASAHFTFENQSEIGQSTFVEESDLSNSANYSSQHVLESRPYKLANLCEEFLNDNFGYSDQSQQSPQTEQSPYAFKKTQSSELSISSSSSSLSLGESSFAAFCLQHQNATPTAMPVSESDDAKTPTNNDDAINQKRDLKEATSELISPSSQASAKKLQHSLSKQDSFNSPDSPLFHKTLPLPKDSVILHHRRHYLKECVSFQSSSSSSEDSDLENLSALRLTPRRPRRNKQRSVV